MGRGRAEGRGLEEKGWEEDDQQVVRVHVGEQEDVAKGVTVASPQLVWLQVAVALGAFALGGDDLFLTFSGSISDFFHGPSRESKSK